MWCFVSSGPVMIAVPSPMAPYLFVLDALMVTFKKWHPMRVPGTTAECERTGRTRWQLQLPRLLEDYRDVPACASCSGVTHGPVQLAICCHLWAFVLWWWRRRHRAGPRKPQERVSDALCAIAGLPAPCSRIIFNWLTHYGNIVFRWGGLARSVQKVLQCPFKRSLSLLAFGRIGEMYRLSVA